VVMFYGKEKNTDHNPQITTTKLLLITEMLLVIILLRSLLERTRKRRTAHMITHNDDAITGDAIDYIGNARRGIIEKLIKHETLAQTKMDEVLATLGDKSTAEIEKLLEDSGRLEKYTKI